MVKEIFSEHILDIHDTHDRHPEIFLEWNKMTCIARYANEIYLDQESSPPPSNIDFIATNKLKQINSGFKCHEKLLLVEKYC